MTILTVRANDTATAMEEIVEKLGTESYILDTKKVGNEMLIKATNNPVKKSKVQSRNIKALTGKFSDMISGELGDNFSPSAKQPRLRKQIRKGETREYSSGIVDEFSFKDMRSELKNLRHLLDGMILTDMAGLSPNLQSTTKVKLQKRY